MQFTRLIVDSQIHVWKGATFDRPWISGVQPQLADPFTIEGAVMMMDEAAVDRAVIVPPALDGDRIDYAQEAVRRYPGRFAIMARVPLHDPATAQRFTNWKQQPGVLGMRATFLDSLGTSNALRDGTTDWLWPAAEKAGLPIMFLTTGQALEFARIAERHPQLVLIVDHMGVSPDTYARGKVAAAIEQCVALAKFPNVSVKLSALPMFSSHPYPFQDVTDHVRRVFDAYGPRRCYWGTDITSSLHKATYRQRVTHFIEEFNFLSEEDKGWVMGRAILPCLGWSY